LLHGEGNEGPRGYEGEGKDDVMVMWVSPFVLVAFKTLGLHPCPPCGHGTMLLTCNNSYLLSPDITHKTKIGTAKGERLLIDTHLDQSNHLTNQQQVLGFLVPC
jgi:hypothetical protein